jgi:PIN domain nuclease of toxin-antitoxin system
MSDFMFPAEKDNFVPEQRNPHGMDSLLSDEPSNFHLRRLPALHRDPFDRTLNGQAIEQGLIMWTPGHPMTQHPVRTLG